MCMIFGFAGRMDSSVCQSTTSVWTNILKCIGWISLECCTHIHLWWTPDFSARSTMRFTFAVVSDFWDLLPRFHQDELQWLHDPLTFHIVPYFVLGMSTTIKCPVRIARNACCLAYYNVTDILVFLTYYVIGLTKSFPDTLNMFVLALKHSLFVINNGVRLLNWWKESSITKLWGPDWGGHRFCFWTSKCHFLKCIYLHRGRNLRNTPEWMPLEPEHFIRFQSVVKDL